MERLETKAAKATIWHQRYLQLNTTMKKEVVRILGEHPRIGFIEFALRPYFVHEYARVHRHTPIASLYIDGRKEIRAACWKIRIHPSMRRRYNLDDDIICAEFDSQGRPTLYINMMGGSWVVRVYIHGILRRMFTVVEGFGNTLCANGMMNYYGEDGVFDRCEMLQGPSMKPTGRQIDDIKSIVEEIMRL